MSMLRYIPQPASRDRQVPGGQRAKPRFEARSPTDREPQSSPDFAVTDLKLGANRRGSLTLRGSRSRSSKSETSSFAVLGKPPLIDLNTQPTVTRQEDAYSRPLTSNPIHHSQMQSAVTPIVGRISNPFPETDVASTTCSDTTNQLSWMEAYQNAPSTRDLLRRLHGGENCDPYVLSDDGLLYAYVPEPDSDMEVSRLVPPEGLVRNQLLLDAKRQLRGPPSASLSAVELAKKMMDSLGANYWWIGMEMDILTVARQDDEERGDRGSWYTTSASRVE